MERRVVIVREEPRLFIQGERDIYPGQGKECNISRSITADNPFSPPLISDFSAPIL